MKLLPILLLGIAACAYDPRRVVVDCHDVVPLDPRYGRNVCDNSGADGGAK